MEPLISVIVPIYKAEKYLDRCVGSIVNQTYKNLEIILVDDGSPDSCPRICDQWAEKDNRIKVIHKENGGLSDARNKALDVCKGELITFVDSDDWISKYYCESLYDSMSNNEADISITGFIRTSESEISDTVPDKAFSILTGKQAIGNLFGPKNIKFVIACAKLYKRELFNQIRFPLGKLHEDDFTTYKLFDKAKIVCECDNSLYYYYQNPESIVGVYNIRRLDAVEAHKERYLFIKEHYKDYSEVAYVNYIYACKFHYQMLCYYRDVDPDESHRKELLSIIRNSELSLVRKSYKGKQKIWFELFLLLPETTCFIRNCFRIGW